MRLSLALATLIVLALISSTSAFEGNQIHLRNDLGAGASGFGRVDQHAGNTAIVCGDDNKVDQFNNKGIWGSEQSSSGYDASNIALVVGQSNDVGQLNDPIALQLGLNQINELMVIGQENKAFQANAVTWVNAYGNVTGDIDQANFGIIFGAGNDLAQFNNASPMAYYRGTVTQDESNAAYIYGINNGATLENNLYASVMDGGVTNQTAKNLAFAITSGDEAFYVPPYRILVMMPWYNSTPQMPSHPDLPNLPSPPAWNSEFTMDP